MENVAIKPPTINWNSNALYQEFQCTKSCNRTFDGPLAGIGDEQKVNYLMMWTDCEEEHILYSLPQGPETKHEEYYKAFQSHIHPTSQFRGPDTAFHD